MIWTLLALSLAGSVAAWPVGRLLPQRAAGWLVALVPAGLFAAFLRLAPTIEAGDAVTRVGGAPSRGIELACGSTG